MKNLLPTGTSLAKSFLPKTHSALWGSCVLILIILSTQTKLLGQVDNFDSGTDTAWAKITNTNYPATYSFPVDSFGGYAYRLQATQSLDFSAARVIAYRPDRLYTNFYAAVDIVAWDELNLTNDQVFGIIARANNIDTGAVDAVTFTTRINRFSDSEGPKGQVQIYGFTGGVPLSGQDGIAQTEFTALIPGRAYRFTFTGVGDFYTGAIYNLEDLSRPLVSISGDGSEPASWGIPIPSSGYVGIFNYSLASGSRDPSTDTTFDNFVAAESPPTSMAPPATPHGLIGAPQVVNRTPASFANFYPAAGGIAFSATTLTTTNPINTGVIRLYLNLVDVSSSLTISGPATNVSVSYNNLASNAVYDARIELQDALGRRVTNSFTFDTFTDAYLAAATAKNIECEDYDHTDGVNDGLFINNPLPSGLTTNSNPVNTSGGGYYGLVGSNAKTNGVDYYSPDSFPDPNWDNFRIQDSINTLQGDYFFGFYQSGAFLFNHTYDTQRQKYANADPALEEYNVLRTKSGTWLNYTRIFPTNSYYNVYLRHGCALSQQQLSLDQITPGPTTNNLGTFAVTNLLTRSNLRYAPLRDPSGKLAVVGLAGTNTIRLTIPPGSPSNADPGSHRYGLSLNYLAFVPALLVESASQATGPYQIETSAAVEPGTRHVTLPKNGGTRFYRLSWDHAVRITSIKLSGGNVQLTYQ